MIFSWSWKTNHKIHSIVTVPQKKTYYSRLCLLTNQWVSSPSQLWCHTRLHYSLETTISYVGRKSYQIYWEWTGYVSRPCCLAGSGLRLLFPHSRGGGWAKGLMKCWQWRYGLFKPRGSVKLALKPSARFRSVLVGAGGRSMSNRVRQCEMCTRNSSQMCSVTV